MAIMTSTVPATNATTAKTDAEKYVGIPNTIVRWLLVAVDASCNLTLLYFQRSMTDCRQGEDSNVVVPVRTTSNPGVVPEQKEQACTVQTATRHSNAPTSQQQRRKDQVISVSNPVSRAAVSESKSVARPQRDSTAFRPDTIPSPSTKRVHSEIADDGDEGTRSKKRRTDENAVDKVNHFVFFPLVVYGYKCLGILFTAGSIRGRGTTVFCVVDLQDKYKLLALNMAWQDLARVAEQDAVMEHLRKQGPQPHPNVIVPLMYVSSYVA